MNDDFNDTARTVVVVLIFAVLVVLLGVMYYTWPVL
jgi:hypothetical protein